MFIKKGLLSTSWIIQSYTCKIFCTLGCGPTVLCSYKFTTGLFPHTYPEASYHCFVSTSSPQGGQQCMVKQTQSFFKHGWTLKNKIRMFWKGVKQREAPYQTCHLPCTFHFRAMQAAGVIALSADCTADQGSLSPPSLPCALMQRKYRKPFHPRAQETTSSLISFAPAGSATLQNRVEAQGPRPSSLLAN